MNIIKTKIGFETKPYITQTIDLDDILNIPIKTWGKILLSFSILLSAANWLYLRQAYHQKTHQLQLLQEEAVQLKNQYSELVKEHDTLVSRERLELISSQIDMHPPLLEETIYLPSHRNKKPIC